MSGLHLHLIKLAETERNQTKLIQRRNLSRKRRGLRWPRLHPIPARSRRSCPRRRTRSAATALFPAFEPWILNLKLRTLNLPQADTMLKNFSTSVTKCHQLFLSAFSPADPRPNPSAFRYSAFRVPHSYRPLAEPLLGPFQSLQYVKERHFKSVARPENIFRCRPPLTNYRQLSLNSTLATASIDSHEPPCF